MAQFEITLPDNLVQGLLTRNDALSTLVESVINQVLEAQVADHLGAAPYQRNEERTGYRNGSRERELTARIGTLTLKVPRVRDGSFSPDLFARYQRSEQALVAAMIEMVICGVSDRKVGRVVEELCGASVSKSTVSSLCRQLDPIVNQWRQRKLSDKAYPFLIVDALVIKIRRGGRVCPFSVLIVTGINSDGFREILGFAIGDSESEATWSALFGSLKERGLSGVELVTSDSHQGLVAAVTKHFQGAQWQRCQVHFMRNILDGCPKSLQEKLRAALRLLFTAADMKTARLLLRQIVEAFSAQAPKAVACLEAGFEDALSVLSIPETYRKRLRSTNSQERLNREIRRREQVIGIFPNEDSAARLLGALLMEQDEAWVCGKRYLDMSTFWEWHRQQEMSATWLAARQQEARETREELQEAA